MTTKLHNYVSMLMFSADRKKVVLIIKNRPSFLNGKLCPVGGHIEEGEEPAVAAAREFEEEAGVHTEASEWLRFAQCEGPDWSMHCFVAFDEQALDCHSTTDEPISIEDVGDLLAAIANKPELASPDLIALVGLALQTGVRESHSIITYT